MTHAREDFPHLFVTTQDVRRLARPTAAIFVSLGLMGVSLWNAGVAVEQNADRRYRTQ